MLVTPHQNPSTPGKKQVHDAPSPCQAPACLPASHHHWGAYRVLPIAFLGVMMVLLLRLFSPDSFSNHGPQQVKPGTQSSPQKQRSMRETLQLLHHVVCAVCDQTFCSWCCRANPLCSPASMVCLNVVCTNLSRATIRVRVVRNCPNVFYPI